MIYSKKLRNIAAISSLLLLTGCITPTINMYNGERISLAPCVKAWGTEELQEDLDKPLYKQAGCDILTRRTLEDIVNNNEMYDLND